MTKKRWLALALALCLCLTGAGCGKKGSGGTGDAYAVDGDAQVSATPTPVAPGDSLTVALEAGPDSIDPTAAVSREEMTILSHLFEGLMKWGDSGRSVAGGMAYAQAVPGMAERYEKKAGADGSVIYTFHLRQAKWSDGKPVTAQDFVYSWQRLLDPANAATYADLLEAVYNAYPLSMGLVQPSDLGVRAVDDVTFEVTLDYDMPWFLELCALPITAPLRQDVIEEWGNRWTYATDSYITNGPYQIAEWDRGYLSVEKCGEYYQTVSGPGAIRFTFSGDTAADLSAYESGATDFLLGVEPTSGQAGRAPYLASYYLMFRTDRSPFDDARVRQAFSLAIDRAALVEAQAAGQTPAGGLVPPGAYGADGAAGADYRTRAKESLDPSKGAYADNCAKARALLSQAGYPEGKGLSEVTYLCPDNPAHTAIGEALAQMWQEVLGVSVTVESVEWGDFLNRCHAGEFTIARGRWVADYNDPLAFLELWWSESAANDAAYGEEQYDDLLERADRAEDPSLRMELMAQAEELLIGRDHALAPLYYETLTYLKKDSLTGVCYSPLGYFIFTQVKM